MFAHIWVSSVILKEERAGHSEISMYKTAFSDCILRWALGSRVDGAVHASSLPPPWGLLVWLWGGRWGSPVSGWSEEESCRIAPALTAIQVIELWAVNFLHIPPRLAQWPHNPILRSLYHRTPVNWHRLHDGLQGKSQKEKDWEARAEFKKT